MLNNIVTKLCNPLLSNDQHGFRQNRSAVTNLSIFKHSILQSLSIHSKTDVTYTDMERAFDRINHKLLISKLESYRFPEPLISCFHSFITGRTQVIKHGNHLSKKIYVTSGVPQGDHLFPILFCL